MDKMIIIRQFSIKYSACFYMIVILIATQISCNNKNGNSPDTLNIAKPLAEEPIKKISNVEAIELANKEFIKNGDNIENYYISVRKFNKYKWIVEYIEKGPKSCGGGYWATVKNDTGEVNFTPDD